MTKIENVDFNYLSVPKLLVVENDLALADMLTELFLYYGFDCIIYHDAEEILPLIETHQPDLVLLDFLLSIVNGGELCSQIKKNTSTSKLPVILYSAFPKVLMSLGDYGCDLFISKPFDLDYLVGQIKHLLAANFTQNKVT
jgi:DNA-binding response OmpR family regulator